MLASLRENDLRLPPFPKFSNFTPFDILEGLVVEVNKSYFIVGLLSLKLSDNELTDYVEIYYDEILTKGGKKIRPGLVVRIAFGELRLANGNREIATRMDTPECVFQQLFDEIYEQTKDNPDFDNESIKTLAKKTLAETSN